MDQKIIVPMAPGQRAALPVGYVPTPSAPYRQHRKAAQLIQQPGAPRAPEQRAPSPFPPGSRVLIWKQDPSVSELGARKSFLSGVVLQGPRGARIASGAPGIAPVSPNAFGDFILAPNTDQFDAVHTFAIVRLTLTMYQRALAAGGGEAPLPWQWNGAGNTLPLQAFPHGLPNVMNAYYSRADQALKFGDFSADGGGERVYTCRSLDIVSHETGHAALDGLKPNWLASSNPPQTGGLHESFGDLSAIFLTLSQLDLVEAIIAQTRADLHDKTFLADMAEQFGLALGRPNGLRNADNDLKLSEAGTEVHAISQVFTGAIYDILADSRGAAGAPRQRRGRRAPGPARLLRHHEPSPIRGPGAAAGAGARRAGALVPRLPLRRRQRPLAGTGQRGRNGTGHQQVAPGGPAAQPATADSGATHEHHSHGPRRLHRQGRAL